MYQENQGDSGHLGDRANQDIIEFIDRYLLDEMPEAEMAKFEEKLSENSALKETFEQQKLIVSSIQRVAAKDELKSLLSKIHAEIYFNQPPMGTNRKIEKMEYHISEETKSKEADDDSQSGIVKVLKFSWLKYPAAAVLKLGMTMLQIVTNSISNRQELFNEFFEPYRDDISPSLKIVGDDLNPQEKIASEIMAHYNLGYFEKLLEVFRNHEDELSKFPDLQFYQGVAHLQQGHAEEAAQIFTDLTESKGRYAHQAYWFSGLAYIHENNRVKAITSLKSAERQKDGEYSDRARLLLANM